MAGKASPLHEKGKKQKQQQQFWSLVCKEVTEAAHVFNWLTRSENNEEFGVLRLAYATTASQVYGYSLYKKQLAINS